MFGATNIIKNSDKEKWVYSGYRIAFDGKSSWNFCNEFARKVIIFGVDNSSSSHTDNPKNNFLILGEGKTYGINARFGWLEKQFSISFRKTKQNFALPYITIIIIVIFLLIEKTT